MNDRNYVDRDLKDVLKILTVSYSLRLPGPILCGNAMLEFHHAGTDRNIGCASVDLECDETVGIDRNVRELDRSTPVDIVFCISRPLD